jgi:hypothetical protein
MGRKILLASVAARGGHVPAAVDNDEARLTEMSGQPVGGDERFHFAMIGYKRH